MGEPTRVDDAMATGAFRRQLLQLSRESDTCRDLFRLLLDKETWDQNDWEFALQTSAKSLLDPRLTLLVGGHLRPWLLELLGWARAASLKSLRSDERSAIHLALCVALSKLVAISSDTVGFILKYFQDAPSPFLVEKAEECDEPSRKKRKRQKQSVSAVTDTEVLQAAYDLLVNVGDLTYTWKWSNLLSYLHEHCEETRWLACQCIAFLSKMSEMQRETFVLKNVSPETHRSLLVKNGMAVYPVLPAVWNEEEFGEAYSAARHTVTISGVSLPVYDRKCQKEGCLVTLPSTDRNLEGVALAVCRGHPVLIEGAVGSGKTSLVEHLACITGRMKAPVLTKVQLGDQTDSKTLLGTYCCTQTPGEFVWRPGSLTQAVTRGYWLLLEDLDYAPMDVISILVPLLESRTLPVPGHGNIRAHPDFQLFATRRTLAGTKMTTGCAGLLDKLWTKVTLETLTRSELLQLIATRWPELESVSERLIGVYLMLSAGQHSDDSENEAIPDADMTTLKVSGRLVSVRDLMKWCSRVASHIGDSSIRLSSRAFQEALDCFCAAVPNRSRCFTFAVHVGSFMNCTKAEVEYYCTQYKPEVKQMHSQLVIGQRAKLLKKPTKSLVLSRSKGVVFSFTRPAACLLERIGVAITNREPVLVVGETGTGKTSTVQYLAHHTGHKLCVINMNQQSDSTDLLGGFKPVEMKTIVTPLRQEYEDLFASTFSTSKNDKFLQHVMVCFANQRWDVLFSLMEHTQKKALDSLGSRKGRREQQVKGDDSKALLNRWNNLRLRIAAMKEQVKHGQSALAFSFIEGALVKAIQEGQWVLLDEINLASAETLECLSGLLESNSGSLTLLERGDNKPIHRHPDFHLFACMNPATDVGKKELPAGLRNRFTEFYMEELQDKQDLMIIINDYLCKLGPSSKQVKGIKDFYKKVKVEAETTLNDGTGHKPHFSLRTLCRALSVAARNPCSSLPRSLFESFCLSFLTQLDQSSYYAVEALIKQHVMGIDPQSKGNGKHQYKSSLDPIPAPSKEKATQIEGYWVPQGDQEPQTSDSYIITEAVRKNLQDLVRVVSIGRFPVLLQGETSVGKTSLITFLAKLTGNFCVRINNHEHTDLQEYVGCYAPDENGKLVFKEGILVKAMRKGHWIILDELNLAPSDVLEALNRLLDDNRELFIPETQETIHAHPHFMLFATQNPPGLYGGRKVLSRAFRNRFVELHFTEIPASQLEVILHKRCEVPLSYSKKMVAVLQELQNMRRGSNLFQGKQSFITLRDLFRWAERYRLAPKQVAKFYDWDQHLADEGYLVLAGRVRLEEEADAIRKVLEKRLKKKVDKDKLFTLSEETSSVTRSYLKQMSTVKGFEHVVWTYDMRRLYILLAKALSFGEPVLLVGETGCGKTTVCQMMAAQNGQELFTVNCHMHTEGADFLGGLRPVRSRVEGDDRLFEWADGPLLISMRGGGMFLADEISLADDSVLERLNSVLEPERTLVLAEKGTDAGADSGGPEVIRAEERFRLIGTMNPGGDYGKKELSPALRNRFTEIWCPKVEIDRVASDVLGIVEHSVRRGVVLGNEDVGSGLGRAMLQFLEHFTVTDLGKKCVLSIRDLLSWVHFVNKVTLDPARLDVGLAYVHGVCLVLLDGLGSGLTGSDTAGWRQLREASLNYVCQQVLQKTGVSPSRTTLQEEFVCDLDFVNTDAAFGVGPFVIGKGSAGWSESHAFTFNAPRTCINLLRLLRGLQLTRPLLLEGSPGVGKTSLVMALAKASSNDIVRINLSEQTDVSDLFGADLPVEGGKGGRFAWRDGPLLQALRQGSWVVLDELNLASQSVLEGLNACFDHRGEIFVPELGKTFQVEHQNTKIFACQNPQHQGGARKGLPKSFLNRFTQVHIEALSSADLEFILSVTYSDLSQDIVTKMVKFNKTLTSEIQDQGLWGHRGGPWELNLRDLFRWCDVMIKNQSKDSYNPGEYVGLIYSDRLRTLEDKKNVFRVYDRIFGEEFPSYQSCGRFHITKTAVQVGHSLIERRVDGDYSEEDNSGDLYMIHYQLPALESLIDCINMNWMALMVGESGVGKTCLIKLLARLTGYRLHTLTVNSDMDVTELLGGFQQVDYGRLLGEVVSDVGIVAWSAVREALLDGEKTHAKKILLTWDELLTARNDKKRRTTSEEMAHFHHQCNLLLVLLGVLAPSEVTVSRITRSKEMEMESPGMLNGTLQNSGGFNEAVKLRDRVRELQEHVTEAGRVSGGGTYHWVDSILVKAVREGEWLLVDGVNLCSASVLDRLNAVLEPGGVLTLSERGVVDGAVPSVTPHPNFRLFLVMDPQYGEISRAMRNRGLEIYMLGSWTAPHDLRSLLLQAGLTSPHLQHALVQAHRAVADILPVYVQPTISQMKQVALVTSQLIQTGNKPDLALTKAFTLVYVRSQGKPDIRRAVAAAIDEAVGCLKTVSDLPWPHYESQVLSLHRLSRGSSVSRVRVMGSLLRTVLLAAENPQASQAWEAAPLPFQRPLPTTESGILQCLIIMMSALSVDDWPLLCAWVSRQVSTPTSEAVRLGSRSLSAIEFAVSSDLCSASKDLTAILGHGSGCDPRYDLRTPSGRRTEHGGVDFDDLANKCSLWVWRTLFYFWKEPQIADKKENSNLRMDRMTVLEISHAVNEGLAGKDALPHASVPFVVPFLHEMHKLTVALANDAKIRLSNQEFFELLTALRWQDRLYQLCCQVVKKAKFHLFLPQLTLHWQWIEEEVLKMPEAWKALASKQLKAVTKRMETVFEKDFNPVHKLAADLRSCVSPASFTSPSTACAHLRLVDLVSSLAPTPDDHKLNNFLASSLGMKVRESLLEVGQKICDADGISDTQEDLSSIEEMVQRGCSKNETSSHSMETDVLALQVQAWPIRDYIAFHALSREKVNGELSPLLKNVIGGAPGVFRELAVALSGPMFRPSSVVGTHSYLVLTNYTASLHTHSLLNYSSAEKDEEEREKVGALHPAACQLTYILLAGWNGKDSIIEQVPAGLHVEKVSQLRAIRSTLWNNWSTLADPALSYEASFAEAATSYITTAVGALAFRVGITPEFNIGVYDLETASHLAAKIAENGHPCLPDDSRKQLHELSRLARELQGCSGDWPDKSAVAVRAVLAMGTVYASILGHLEPVDPAQRHRLLLQYHREELEDLESHLMISEWFERSRGCLDRLPPQQAHPHRVLMRDRCDHLETQMSHISQQVAHRPDPPKYHQLRQDFTHFLSTVFTPEKMRELSASLEACKSAPLPADIARKVECMLSSCDNFVRRVIHEHPLYRDVTYPFLRAVAMTCEGLRLASCHSRLRDVDARCGHDLTKTLETYSSFPAPRDPSKPLRLLSEQLDITSCVPTLLPEDSHPGRAKMANNTILRAALLDLLNVAVAQQRLDTPTVELAARLHGRAASLWRRQQEEKALRAQEEESLYRYKARTVAASETEDETLEREFREAFPSFDHEFDDLNGLDVHSEDADDKVDQETVLVGDITDEQLYELSEVHHLIFTGLARTAWLAAPSSADANSPSQIVPAAILRTHVLRTLVGRTGCVASSSLDRSSIGAHILGNHNSCAVLAETTPSSLLAHPYDIYRDPNPEEALKVRPLLQSLRVRVDELLDQWPGHPTLVSVNAVIARVLSFPLTSPLTRLVVGLETALEKAQDWERNAHSGVSMMEQLEAVTRQVLEWRQLELRSWRSCLDSVTHKVATEGRKWWPHLHDALHAGTTGTAPEDETFKTLLQFVETSTLGDFQTRLRLLYAFHCNLAATVERSERADRLLAHAWNLHQYYAQFGPLVASTLAKARQPIEKEVRGYAKIARWNDINFFAVRESVAKSHRTLHRHMKNWEKKLRQPVAPVLRDAGSELTPDHDGEWDKERVPYVTPAPVSPPVPNRVNPTVRSGGDSILCRVDKLTRRCHRLTRRMLAKLPYGAYADALEDATDGTIASYRELQAAESRAEDSAPDARLKQLRSVVQRRRDLLARTFKSLASLGVAYTRGNSLWNHDDVDACFALPPLDLDVAHADAASLKSAKEAWPGCVRDFNRCISRQVLLLASLQQQRGDLGPELVRRLRGASCHLFLLTREQRRSVAHVSEYCRRLRLVLGDLRSAEPRSIPAATMLGGFERLHALAASLSLTVAETSALLATLSDAPPLLSLQDDAGLQQVHADDAKVLLDEVGAAAGLAARRLAKCTSHLMDGGHLVTPEYSGLFSEMANRLSKEADKLGRAIGLLSAADGGELPLTSQLTKWLRDWRVAQAEFASMMEVRPRDDARNGVSVSDLEHCVVQSLLCVENMYKRHCSGDGRSEGEELEAVENLLSRGIIEGLERDGRELRLKEVVTGLQELTKRAEDEPALLDEIKAALPILGQYEAVCQSVLQMMVCSHGSVARFASVVLDAFQQAVQKGFSRPEESQDGPGWEGAKKFEDSEGMGLGDGEGQKDVSDRIESEDQLESALKEGETEKSGDRDLEDEDQGIEMDQDFEGKLQDVKQKEKDGEGSDEDDNEDVDKVMGETERGAERLDEKLWDDDGDEEEEEEEKENKEREDEDGPGDGEVTESKMVAKDDNKSKKERDKDQKKKNELEEMEDTREENKMDEDGKEYDDNFADAYGGEDDRGDEEDEEKMELPEDMQLDDAEANDAEENEEGESDPMEIEEKGVFPEEEREPKEKDEGELEEGAEERGKEDGDKNAEEQASEEEEGDRAENDEGESKEETKKDERRQGTEEVNDVGEDDEDKTSRETAEASKDKDTETAAEAAEMDTTEGSKDQTKEQPKSDAGGQREDEEDEQEEQGQTGEQTEDQEGVGQSESRTRDDAHQGESSALVTQSSANDQNDMKKPRKPGETDEDRTLGDNEKEVQQGLMTNQTKKKRPEVEQQQEKDQDDAEDESKRNSQHEHISKAEDHFDAQIVDAGTQEQAKEMPAPADRQEEEEKAEENDEMLETPMEVDEEDLAEAGEEKEATAQEGERRENHERSQGRRDPLADGETKMETEGDIVLESLVERPPETFFHTLIPERGEEEEVSVKFEDDEEETRRKIEVVSSRNGDDGARWMHYEARVAPMAMQLCEQLRLILEPTQASRLRGDYRTGKRLNMRKVIPYIASQFRKDKIWLRRTQPSKRTYQILIAVDDSESMAEARAGSLAVESVALVTRALTLLEAGQLGVVSFGESTRILHPFDEPFGEASGSRIISHLNFDQKVTNFSRMLEDCVALLNGSRTNSSHGNPDTAQLLLVLSDGQTQTRSATVRAAVRAARAARIFIVFLVLDAKDNKYSFYDVLVYENGLMRPLVQSFPFPFFLVVRDLDTLPDALATALRQWFELVTVDANQ